jgi:hypothetical protein
VLVFHEAFSIHPSRRPFMDGITQEKALAEINNPSSVHASLSKKGMSGLRVLIVKRLGQRVIEVKIIAGNNVNKCVFIFLFKWHLQ